MGIGFSFITFIILLIIGVLLDENNNYKSGTIAAGVLFGTVVSFIMYFSVICMYAGSDSKIIRAERQIVYESTVYDIDSVWVTTQQNDTLLINFEEIEYR